MGERGSRKTNKNGNSLKRGAWTVADLRGVGVGLGKKEGGAFMRGVDTPMHTV